MFRVNLSQDILFQVKRMGPSPRNTIGQFDEVIDRCVGRILAVFDDSVQFGLVTLRLNEIAKISASGI